MMKACPKCKKEIAEHAKICPYCGAHVEPGYQPMKRNRTPKNGYIYIVMAFIFMFSPLIFGYFFNMDTMVPTTTNDGQKIILGKLEDVENKEEYVSYQFDDLDAFKDQVEGVEKTVAKIKTFEKQVEEIVEQEMDKEYSIYITDLNNVYYNLEYQIAFTEQETMNIHILYDRAALENNVTITTYQHQNKSFEDLVYTEEKYAMLEKIITIINEKEETLLPIVGNEFNTLEPTFEKRKETLGHYGIGVHKLEKEDTCNMKISGYVDDYTVKCIYQTKANLKKLL